MRIGVIGRIKPDSFAENIGDALARGGHMVSYLGTTRASYRSTLLNRISAVALEGLRQFDERKQNAIVRSAGDAACDLIISVDSLVTPETVSRLKKTGCTVVFWFPDAVSNIGRQLMVLAPYDALFFKEPHLVDRLAAVLDVPVYYLPQGCNPRWHAPIGDPATDKHFIIAGNMYPTRVRLLERLLDKGIPLRVYGRTFPAWIGDSPLRAAHTGEYITREHKARIFRSAIGVLNSMHPAEITGVNSRLFEAAACGAPVLTEYRPSVPGLFELGTEVLTYSDFDELIDRAHELLADSSYAGRLGDAAAARAHRDHTYDMRVATLLEKVL